MLRLIQGYYHFLMLGKFMEQLMLTNDLSDLAMDYPLRTGKNTSFMLKERMLKRLFTSFYGHQEQRNVYGYLTEISAFRGIFSVMREMIENDANFREYLKDLLREQYFPFEQLIRFLRNVLNHTTTSSLKLKLEDYEVQRDFILSPKVQRVQRLNGSARITLDFYYSEYVAQRKGSLAYGIQLSIDFKKLKPDLQLEKLVSRHQLYLLSELCFNIAQLADQHFKPKKQKN
ncbi:MAG: hypothetical protein HG439_002935 [candidate division SR1 bacterium]|nr:hypothetical protein [candidate division SR1 bacterium]